MAELPFYDQLNIIKTNQAFSGYATSYKVEIVDKKYLIVQLEGFPPNQLVNNLMWNM